MVLPFVPVTRIQSAILFVLSRKRHASSISTQTARPLLSAQVTIGDFGATPGETTSTCALCALISSGPSVATCAPMTCGTPMTSRISIWSDSAFSAITNTSAPNSANVSATENPVTPKPKTTTRSPRQLECQLIRPFKFFKASCDESVVFICF